MTWDGKERRKVTDNDHDILIRIDANLTNHINLVSRHVQEDEDRFSKVEKDLQFHNKIVYGALGVIVFLQIVSKFLIK